jgi:ATP synthase in type III secretion protein N
MNSIHARSRETALTLEGRVTATKGPLLLAKMPLACLGAQVEIKISQSRTIIGIITGFSGEQVSIAPLEDATGVTIGATIQSTGKPPTITLPRNLNGLIVDGSGRQLNPALNQTGPSLILPLSSPPPAPLLRAPIQEQLVTGISAIDGFSPIGIGQRLSLIAPAGTGKSTLLGMITRNSSVDHVVVALIGERGREVREFLDEILGESGAQRSTIIVSTSDEPPIKKLLAADIAFSISEYYRNQGKKILLIVDSLTRLARAMRDIGLANGEIPVRQGFPASVLVALPRLLERAGNNQYGSITALFSLLQEDGHGNDYLSHEVASLLDGHLVLDPRLAAAGHYPALNVTTSLSRLTNKLLTSELQRARQTILSGLSRLYRERDLLLLGGTPDQELVSIMNIEKEINELLKQEVSENRSFEQTSQAVSALSLKL